MANSSVLRSLPFLFSVLVRVPLSVAFSLMCVHAIALLRDALISTVVGHMASAYVVCMRRNDTADD